MKINLSYPATGCQKLIEISDELKVQFLESVSWVKKFWVLESGFIFSSCLQVRPFYEKRMGQEVEGDTLGDEVDS